MKYNRDISDIKNRIKTEDDFINSKKYDNSLEKFLKRHPNGVPDNIIAVLLCMETSEIQSRYKKSIKKLQNKFKL